MKRLIIILLSGAGVFCFLFIFTFLYFWITYDNETTTKTVKPIQNKDTIAQTAVKQLKPKLFIYDYTTAFRVLRNLDNDMWQISSDKEDNLLDSWVRWTTTIEFTDKSQVKLYRNNRQILTQIKIIK